MLDPSRIERLASGEAESIGNKGGKFHAEDARGNILFAETGPIPSQREAVIRIGRLLVDAKMPAGRDRASHCPRRAETPAALPHRRLRF